MQAGRIEAVLFDAVGTLFHPIGTVGEIYRQVALKHGADVPAERLQADFVQAVARRGTPIDKTAWRSLVEELFRAHGRFQAFDTFFEEVYEFFQSGRTWMCYSEVGGVLRILEQNHYPMGVVSNFDRRLLQVLRELDIAKYFRMVVTPESAGQAKPDPRIFIDAVSQIPVEPQNALFVGDDPALDIAGARRAGLQTLLVDRFSSIPSRGVIQDLRGTLSLLGLTP